MNDAYDTEARALDSEILRCISRREVPDFSDLALRIFAHQLRYNEPYARFCASLGVTPDCLPGHWEAIPPVPAAAYKEASLCTFDSAQAAVSFETSGTTRQRPGKHYMERTDLYDASLLAGFQDAMLEKGASPLRYLLLVPDPCECSSSSLGYMMRAVAQTYGDGNDGWYVHDDVLHVDAFEEALSAAAKTNTPVCIAGTAFAFVNLLDDWKRRGKDAMPLVAGSRIMETGGFKGRTRIVEREQLYAELSALFAVDPRCIIAEYGMTELSSQYYDVTFDAVRIKAGPPWLRARVVGPDRKTLPAGVVGALAHVDLANRSSCVAVLTEDLGVAMPQGGIVLLGRDAAAQLRGCSLDAEQLRALPGR